MCMYTSIEHEGMVIVLTTCVHQCIARSVVHGLARCALGKNETEQYLFF